jgi:hypothetical protein
MYNFKRFSKFSYGKKMLASAGRDTLQNRDARGKEIYKKIDKL